MIVTSRPSTKCLKNFKPEYIVRSSRSYVLYLYCVSDSFFKKNPSGFQLSSWYCFDTAPIARFEASVLSINLTFSKGCANKVATASRFLLFWKAVSVFVVQIMGCLSFFFFLFSY